MKKKIFKKALSILTSSVVLLSMVGCNSKKNDKNEKVSEESSVSDSYVDESSDVITGTEVATETSSNELTTETTTTTSVTNLLSDGLGEIEMVEDETTTTIDENRTHEDIVIVGEERIVSVNYSGNVYVVDGVPYASYDAYIGSLNPGEEPKQGTVEYYRDGQYYVSEDAYNQAVAGEVTIPAPETQEDVNNIPSGLYWDDERKCFWESYEIYLEFTGQSYEPNIQPETEYNEYTGTGEEVQYSIIGPDGQYYNSIEEYLAKVNGTTTTEPSYDVTIEDGYHDGLWWLNGDPYASYEAYQYELERLEQEAQQTNGRQR